MAKVVAGDHGSRVIGISDSWLRAVKDWELRWPRALVNLILFTAVLNYS